MSPLLESTLVIVGTTLLSVVRATWSEGGLASFYRGLAATLCLDLPFALLQFPLYEHLRHRVSRLLDHPDPSWCTLKLMLATSRVDFPLRSMLCHVCCCRSLSSDRILTRVRVRHGQWMAQSRVQLLEPLQ